VLYALVAAKQDLHDRSDKLGDIKPENIFVNEQGAIRIANVYSWPNEVPSFAKALDQEKLGYNGLLAPEDLAELKRGGLQNDSNEHSEVFAVGATILSAGILGDFSGVYNYQDKTFDLAAFRDKRRAWAETARYSEIFRSIVLDLTAENPNDRLTFSELWEWVSEYQASILERKQFVIKNAPPKI
jgi:serine/threonine protein kinase